jgi:uncharacterized integral membrane protein
MRILATFAKLAVFLALLGFAIKNTDPVTVRYYLGYEWQAPLVAVLFVFFGAGAVLGVLAVSGILFRQRRRLARLERTQAGSDSARNTGAVADPVVIEPPLPAEAVADPGPGRRR